MTNYTSEDRNCTGQKYSAGQGFIDSGKDVHILRNEGSVLAETIAVQLLAANTPSRRIDQPAPGNCPFEAGTPSTSVGPPSRRLHTAEPL